MFCGPWGTRATGAAHGTRLPRLQTAGPTYEAGLIFGGFKGIEINESNIRGGDHFAIFLLDFKYRPFASGHEH